MPDPRSDAFRIEVREHTGATRIVCSGELDAFVAHVLDEEIKRRLGEPASALTIDCSAITFVDSEGVRTLTQAVRACREANRPLDFVLSEPVRRTLDILGVELTSSSG